MEDVVETDAHVNTVRVPSRVLFSSDSISEKLSFFTIEMSGLGVGGGFLHGVVTVTGMERACQPRIGRVQ